MSHYRKTIGLGCSTFGGSRSKKTALDALQYAFDHGITHLDVARSYGYGQAESIVGEFIHDKRDQVILTSKFGISPPRQFPFMQEIKDLVRQAKEAAPEISQKIIQLYSAFFVKRPAITPKLAIQSLEKSLSELKTDYLDYYLLHDCPFQDASRDDVCAALEMAKHKGMIRQWGATCENVGELPLFFGAESPFELVQFQYGSKCGFVGGKSERPVSKVLFAIMSQCAGMEEPHASFFHELPIQQVAPGLVRNLQEAWLYIASQELDAGVVLCSMTNPLHIRRNIAIVEGPVISPAELRKMKRMVLVGKLVSAEAMNELTVVN